MKRFLCILFFALSFQLTMFAQGTWSGVGSGLNLPVSALTTDPAANVLYAGGIFTASGILPTIGIAKWDGSTWSDVGGGILSGTGISSMIVDGDGNLIVGGSFTNIGGILSNNIALWDGSIWQTLGDGLQYTGATTVSTLSIYNDVLYAGGTFNSSGGDPVSYVAKWNGTDWESLGTGVNGSVYSMCVHNGLLYVGGSFTLAGSISVNNIAAWDGSTWSDVGGGVQYTGATTVSTMEVFNDTLYIGGQFTIAGSAAVHNIAKWDGSTWSDVGGGVEYTGATTVSTLKNYNDGLMVGGTFNSAGGDPYYYIARWDGSSWSSVGGGVSSSVYDLEAYGGKLIAGGAFLFTGGTSTLDGGELHPFIAQYQDDNEEQSISREQLISGETRNDQIILYPNPAQRELNIRATDQPVMVFELYDALGKQVARRQTASGAIRFDRGNMAPGLYFFTIRDKDHVIIKEGKISFE